MVKKIHFAQNFRKSKLGRYYKDIYVIDSEVNNQVSYCYGDSKFAVLLKDGAMVSSVEEIPQVAELAKSEELKAEILEVYEELKVLVTLGTSYFRQGA